MLLNASKLEENQKYAYELAYLNFDTNDQLLDKLAEFDKDKLLTQNLNQIDFIIDNDSELNIKALETLLKCLNKENIPDKLLDSISVLLTNIDPTMNIYLTVLEGFLNNMRQEYQRSRKFSDLLSIQKLFSLKIPKDEIQNNLEQELVNIYALILTENAEYSSNQSIVDSLEKAILSKTLKKNILNAYKKVIKRTRCQTNHFHHIFDIFIDISSQNNKLMIFHFDILVCIASVFQAKKISKLEPLENNLFNDNEIIRTFQQWCDQVIDKLEENIEIDVNLDLDLFETISALKYIDFDKIRDKPQNQWNRELLKF
ncbi:unnamed protein product [Rotaria sp. Silwood2]|nr:unnamed protein product [Rotaria sp. Silwood2]CAF4464640.1 unnamed protein product [Rotaria sp. Silwood2]